MVQFAINSPGSVIRFVFRSHNSLTRPRLHGHALNLPQPLQYSRDQAVRMVLIKIEPLRLLTEIAPRTRVRLVTTHAHDTAPFGHHLDPAVHVTEDASGSLPFAGVLPIIHSLGPRVSGCLWRFLGCLTFISAYARMERKNFYRVRLIALRSASSAYRRCRRSCPKPLTIVACASCHSGNAVAKACWPRGVSVTCRSRRSSPGSM